jgi:signal transduction histidine kinase
VLDPDPYLAFLVRSTFPDAQIATLQDAEMLGRLAGRVDLAVVDLDGPGALRFLVRQPGLKVVGIADGPRTATTIQPSAVVDLVLRPFAPAELSSALLRAAGLDTSPAVAQREPGKLALAWLLSARIATVVVATLLQLATRGLSGPAALVVPAVLAYVGLSLVVRRRSDAWALADLVVATVAIALTGGLTSPYSAFGIVAVAATALTVGSFTGALCGLIPIVGPALTLIGAGHRAPMPGQLIMWFGFFPLASLMGAILGHAGLRQNQRGPDLAKETHHVLSALFHIARTLPGGFDLRAVAAAALQEVAASSGSPAGMLLLREAGIVKAAGSFGIPGYRDETFPEETLPDKGLFGQEPNVVTAFGPPHPLSALTSGHLCWISSPLRTDGVTFGTLLTACTDCSLHAPTMKALGLVAYETGLAVENTRLFAHVQELSANEERRHLGRELHDGLAQALFHLRLELEMLAKHGSDSQTSFQTEAARLARVAAGALLDVQSTIAGLRWAPAGGLAEALSSYLRDIRSLGGPEVRFVATGQCHLPVQLEAEMFRVGQEAVSNALRHAEASTITVTLGPRGAGAMLIIEDDGHGIRIKTQAEASTSTGVGLRSMKERARRMGGRLSISSGTTCGTRIELVMDAEAPEVGPADDVLIVETGRP